MKTEQEIKEERSYLKGYLNASLTYGITIDNSKFIKGKIEALEWVLSRTNEVNNEK